MKKLIIWLITNSKEYKDLERNYLDKSDFFREERRELKQKYKKEIAQLNEIIDSLSSRNEKLEKEIISLEKQLRQFLEKK